MKRKLKACCLVASLFIIMSCGKYGYDFVDGYQDGDKDGSKITTDTSMNNADRSLFHRARIFPGLVGDDVKRIADTTIIFNMDYEFISRDDLKVSNVPPPIFSTGLYAPAGENIRITVPSGVFGLTVQVGVHMDNLTGKSPLRRDPIIFTRKELFPGVNYVKNLYGGTIWILTNNSRVAALNLKFAGAVHSPDFVLGESNPQKWIADVEKTEVPWVELRSKRVVFSVPRSYILNYKTASLQVADALKEWNEIYEKDFYDWMGLSEHAADKKNKYPSLPERAVLDIQTIAGYAHSGNPWVAQLDGHWFSMFVQRDYIINKDEQYDGSWGAFHELGHNYQQTNTWSWEGLGETTNNLFIWKAANRLNNLSITNPFNLIEPFDIGLEYARKTTSKNIVTDAETTTGSHAFVKILLFLQIYNKAVGKNGESGWDFMPYIYKNARNTEFSFSLDQAKRDYFYRNLCDFTGQDWQKFCRAWGIQISAVARNEMAAKYLPLDKEVWTYNPLTNTGGDGQVNPKEDLNNREWTVLAKSTEEPSGEGSNNGRAIHMIDGNPSTFWQSQWTGSGTTLPISVTFQLSNNEVVKGFYLLPRTSLNERPRNIEIQISKDNLNYKSLTDADLETGYSFEMANTADRKEFRLKVKEEIRYVRFFIRETNYTNTNFHGIAEFGAFFDVD